MPLFFIVFFIFISCSREGEEPEEVFARVGEKKLTKEDIVAMKKRGLVSEGSVSHLVNRWIGKMLLYDCKRFLLDEKLVDLESLIIINFLFL